MLRWVKSSTQYYVSGGKYNRFVITKAAHPVMRRFEEKGVQRLQTLG